MSHRFVLLHHDRFVDNRCRGDCGVFRDFALCDAVALGSVFGSIKLALFIAHALSQVSKLLLRRFEFLKCGRWSMLRHPWWHWLIIPPAKVTLSRRYRGGSIFLQNL